MKSFKKLLKINTVIRIQCSWELSVFLRPLARYWPFHLEAMLIITGQEKESSWWPTEIMQLIKLSNLGKICIWYLSSESSQGLRALSHSFSHQVLHWIGMKYYPFRKVVETVCCRCYSHPNVFFHFSGPMPHLPQWTM